jgi:hypothetical protein
VSLVSNCSAEPCRALRHCDPTALRLQDPVRTAGIGSLRARPTPQQFYEGFHGGVTHLLHRAVLGPAGDSVRLLLRVRAFLAQVGGWVGWDRAWSINSGTTTAMLTGSGLRPLCSRQLQARLDQVDFSLPTALGNHTIITGVDEPTGWQSSASSSASMAGGLDADEMGRARAAAAPGLKRPEDKPAASELQALAAVDMR